MPALDPGPRGDRYHDAQRLQAITAAPVVVILNQIPARGRDADDAEEALCRSWRIEVCAGEDRSARIVLARALLDGLTAQEA